MTLELFLKCLEQAIDVSGAECAVKQTVAGLAFDLKIYIHSISYHIFAFFRWNGGLLKNIYRN